MVALQKYQDKKIAIYGMGITGCSAAKTFKRLKAKVFCWDDSEKIRKKREKRCFVSVLRKAERIAIPKSSRLVSIKSHFLQLISSY